MIDDDDIKENAEEAAEETASKADSKEAKSTAPEVPSESEEVKPEAEKTKDGEEVKEFKPESFDEESTEKPAELTTEEKLQNEKTITVQPVQFASFEDLEQVQGPQNQNLNILLDVKLQLSVELGKTDLPIKKVLELTKGSIVTLNKAAGEPVELYANGKLIAYGEVVVIEDNFGLRITHITDPVKRLNTINSGHGE
ncbi:flagellar motor switch protein FliN [bacterium]|nr:flagellar motor switch protein FliN [bacterium]